jgi:hypothetical protein
VLSLTETSKTFPTPKPNVGRFKEPVIIVSK